jgi:hypothetical protein
VDIHFPDFAKGIEGAPAAYFFLNPDNKKAVDCLVMYPSNKKAPDSFVMNPGNIEEAVDYFVVYQSNSAEYFHPMRKYCLDNISQQ